MMRRCGALVVFGVVVAGCVAATTHSVYPDDLKHSSYIKRSLAAWRFAELRDESQLPGAFDLLLDRQEHIRGLAWETIRDLTPGGRDFGYKPYFPRHRLEGIVKRWRAYWEAARKGLVDPEPVEHKPATVEEAESGRG